LINCSARTENLDTEAGLMRTARAVQSLITHAPGAIQRDRDMARKKQARPAPAKPAAEEQLAAPVKHPDDEVLIAQKLWLYSKAVFPVVADHLPLEYLTDSDCRLLLELMLDHPGEPLSELVPTERPEAQRLAARIQMEETKMRGEDVLPAKAAQDIVMALWTKALQARKRSLVSASQPGETAAITMQLQCLKKGWEHAVDFLVV